MSKLGALVAGILSLCVMSVAIYLWYSIGNVDMSTGGYLALIGGGLATFGLGAGLMALVFYSNRKGFDERAGGAVSRPTSDTPSVENDHRAG
ncbi:MAG TPA: hypothetical protein VL993_10220 [Stellaceae bacterium]|nr:hypothetical protein [Stellaceae bacterium]